MEQALTGLEVKILHDDSTYVMKVMLFITCVTNIY